MTEEPDDEPFDGSDITEEELVEARKRHATMKPIIPDIFACAIVGDGIRADVLIGYDKLPDSTPK